MTLALPRVTSDRLCCPRCRQPSPYLPTGRTDWHLAGDVVCPDVWPPYVLGAPGTQR